MSAVSLALLLELPRAVLLLRCLRVLVLALLRVCLLEDWSSGKRLTNDPHESIGSGCYGK